MFGLFRNKSDRNLQDVFLGAGAYLLKVSKQYLTERDEKEGTVMIYPKGNECITLRIDVLSFSPNDENKNPLNGYEYVRENAENGELFFENDMAILFKEKKSIENGTDVIMKFWTIGPNDNRIIIMSATILEKLQNDTRVKELLGSIPDIIKSIEPTRKHDSIETSSGAVHYTTTKVEQTNEKIIQTTNDDEEFITQWLENGWNIILYYIPKLKKNELTIDILDAVFEKWINDNNREKFNSESIANGLGLTFGDILVREFNMSWIKVVDEYGEEIAVKSQKGYTSYPISIVYKRIDSKETGFFNSIFAMVDYSIDRE